MRPNPPPGRRKPEIRSKPYLWYSGSFQNLVQDGNYKVTGCTMAEAQMDAENTHQVFDWLWTSGQLSERDIRELSPLGIAVVINLALPTSSNALPGEADLVTRQGIAYVQIPVLWEKPEIPQFLEFVGILRAFTGKRIWVHCAMNKRVSAFVYLYRKLVLREDDDAATFPLRLVWTPDVTWRAFIDDILLRYHELSGNPA
jgi:protein tyrosine phosphatase (PTP) superfamily phosphohydrolase (DUF442 family)